MREDLKRGKSYFERAPKPDSADCSPSHMHDIPYEFKKSDIPAFRPRFMSRVSGILCNSESGLERGGGWHF